MPGTPTPHPAARPAQRQLRVSVPGSVFTRARLPAFPLFDEVGEPVTLDRHWDADRVDEVVTVAPADLVRLRAYLAEHVGSIAADEGAPLADRAWAVHAALGATAWRAAGSDPERLHAADLMDAVTAAASLIESAAGMLPFVDVMGGQSPDLAAADVSVLAGSLAATDGCSGTRLAYVVLGGLFADIGKQMLPASVLQRSGPLSPIELAAVRRHPEYSARWLERVGVRASAALHLARWHHERWDGGGYPGGLTGDAIPVEARWGAIADAYRALTEERPYAPARDPLAALQEMADSVGQFEPRLLRAFVTLVGASLLT